MRNIPRFFQVIRKKENVQVSLISTYCTVDTCNDHRSDGHQLDSLVVNYSSEFEFLTLVLILVQSSNSPFPAFWIPKGFVVMP